MFACALFSQAVRDYTATKPRDTGHFMCETRISIWRVNRTSAEWFLFKDVDYMGTFHIFCILIRIDPNTARKILINRKHDLADIVKKLVNAAKALDIANDK
jgi:hypothetical protein